MTDPVTLDPEPLARLVRRLRAGERVWTSVGADRFDEWLDDLERDPAQREALAAAFRDLLTGTRHVSFSADLGVMPPGGFLAEIGHRLLHKLLPPDLDEGQLQDWARRLFSNPAAAAWALGIPADRWRRLARLLGADALPVAVRRRIALELCEALTIVSARIAAIGVDPLVARVHPDAQHSASPFLEQQPAVWRRVEAWRAAWADGAEPPDEDDRPIRALLEQCRAVIRRIHRGAGRTGVTVELTYRLRRLAELVDRLETLLDLTDATRGDAARAEAWFAFLRRQIHACGEAATVRALWRRSTEVAALEIVEHAGRTGEHYIAADRSEWWGMLRSAAVAGVVIAVMAIAKVLIGGLHAPPLIDGLLVALNYGFGFVLIHLVHGTVATKQPAMTAARIAAEIGEARADGERRDWTQPVAALLEQVIRSQWIAVVGNVGVALPLAVALVAACLALLGASPATPEKADLLLAQLDPLGATLAYAAIAGVCLFLSGVVSGYCDNLAVFHRVPRRVARMPLLVRAIGRERAAAVGAYVEHNLGALVGNFLFGCMLGGVTLMGTLTGLPLDIRHVAFGAANLGIAGTTLWPQPGWTALAVAATGVLLIAVVNLAVSFTLSLMLALRARGLESRGIGRVWRTLGRRALTHPLDLLRPPRGGSYNRSPDSDPGGPRR